MSVIFVHLTTKLRSTSRAVSNQISCVSSV